MSKSETTNYGLSDIDRAGIDAIVVETKRRREAEAQELRAKSKPLHELVVPECFDVKKVISHSSTPSFTPSSEMKLGRYSPVYSTGYSTRLVLEVVPVQRGSPIRMLTFLGHSGVRGRDRIQALIPRYEQRSLSAYDEGEGIFSSSGNPAGTVFLDREFRAEEAAIELAILSHDKSILRVDRAVDYAGYMKK